ncbi:hypothetical protein [Chitinophaga flava]|uniref:DUF2214 domain-containing protein n=1 Tax=Chitinophaga flava TaxID=2259036 RepID=A0A365XYF8_9BACT|nr:hypothetical protein [Chitinophaga flava]RBL91098.1 hypothetical protein DF182_00310 [Chitinophaga flava]
MNMYLLSLLVHITGLAMMAGLVLAGFLANRRFWQVYQQDRVKAAAIIDLTSRFPMMMGIGFLLLLLSGISLMAQVHGVYGEQLWFRVKMLLLLLLVLNGFVGRRLGMKMRPHLLASASGQEIHTDLAPMKGKVTLFYVVQLLLLLLVFICGVFKFS